MGLGSRDRIESPRKVEALMHERISSGAAGAYHSLVVTKFGDLYSFGAHYKKENSSTLYFGTGNLPAYKRAMIEESYLSYLRASNVENEASSSPSSSSDSDQADEPHPTSGGGAYLLHRNGAGGTFKRVIQDLPKLVAFPCGAVRILSVSRRAWRCLQIRWLVSLSLIPPIIWPRNVKA